MNFDNIKLAYLVLKTYDEVVEASTKGKLKFFYMMTNLKLQKMSYFVYGLILSNDKSFNFCPEFKKWKLGPVMENVYYQVRLINKGGFSIDFASYNEFINLNFKEEYNNIKDFAKNNSSRAKDLIEKMWKKDAFDMVEKSHNTDPWQNTENSTKIMNDKIANYFKDKKLEDIF